jgi:hypothetical protein
LPPPTTADEAALQAQEIGEVTGFARTGKPRAKSAPRWPQFSRGGSIMSLAPGGDSQLPSVDLIAAAHHCERLEYCGRA